MMTPMTVVMTTVIKVMTSVSQKACLTSGRENVSPTIGQPG